MECFRDLQWGFIIDTWILIRLESIRFWWIDKEWRKYIMKIRELMFIIVMIQKIDILTYFKINVGSLSLIRLISLSWMIVNYQNKCKISQLWTYQNSTNNFRLKINKMTLNCMIRMKASMNQLKMEISPQTFWRKKRFWNTNKTKTTFWNNRKISNMLINLNK